MPGTYSGAWRRHTVPINRVPRHPGIHPDHANPKDVPDPTDRDLTGAPLLPEEWSGGQYLQDHVPSAYADLTPADPTHGVGFLPGVDQDDASWIGGRARSEDLGAADARDHERPRYQEDGTVHTQEASPVVGSASPATLALQERGVGVGIDPHARSNTQIRRYPVGPAVFDMRWYGDEMRPKSPQTARGSTARPPVPNRQVNTPTEGAGGILRPDNWAQPVVRRAPGRWDQGHTADDPDPPPQLDTFGLGTWGL